jgi:hypothetical protein
VLIAAIRSISCTEGQFDQINQFLKSSTQTDKIKCVDLHGQVELNLTINATLTLLLSCQACKVMNTSYNNQCIYTELGVIVVSLTFAFLLQLLLDKQS